MANEINEKTHVSISFKTMIGIVSFFVVAALWVSGKASEFDNRIRTNNDLLKSYELKVEKIPVLIFQLESLDDDLKELSEDISQIKDFLIPKL